MSDAISAILNHDAISLRLEGRKKPEIIRELVELLAGTGVVTDLESVTAEVMHVFPPLAHRKVHPR